MRRRIYAGDFVGERSETNITEPDWYATAPGRAVRSESNSGYMDPARCSDEMSACRAVRGDWQELVEVLEKKGIKSMSKASALKKEALAASR